MYSVINLFKLLENRVRLISDPAYQERVWIKHQGKEVFDYDDLTMYFMDECEYIFAHPDQYEGVNDFILKALRELYDKVSTFDDNIAAEIKGGDDELIATPEWREVQQLAVKTYETIHKNLKDRNYEPGTSL